MVGGASSDCVDLTLERLAMLRLSCGLSEEVMCVFCEGVLWCDVREV